MRRTTIVLWSLALVCLAIPARAHAQERKGFWIGAGGGYGSAGVSCEDCGGGREESAAGYLKAGWTLNKRTLLGGEVNLWNKSERMEEATGTVNLYNISGTITFYPAASSGFFVRGGAGASFMDMDFEYEGTKFSTELGRGPGLLAGAGYDLRVARRIAVTPAVNVWYGHIGDLTFEGETFASKWRHHVIDVTIGITFQ
jgi:hypothetical protein